MALLGVAMVGAAVWLWIASGGVESNVSCLLGGYNSLKILADNPPACSAECTSSASCTCTDWSSASAAFDAFPSAVLDAVKMVLDRWAVIVITPGAFYGGLLLLISLLAYMTLKNRRSPAFVASCTKAWNIIGLVLVLWPVVIVFAVFGATGFGRRIGPINTLYESSVSQPCSEQASAIAAMVTDSQENFDSMSCASPPVGFAAMCAEASTSIDHAREISLEFTSLCICVGVLLKDAEPLAAPGVTGLVLVIMLLFAHLGLCAVMGCCSKYIHTRAREILYDSSDKEAEFSACVGEARPFLYLEL